MIFWITYICTGIFLSILLMWYLNSLGVTGDDILDMIEDDEVRGYLRERPGTYKNMMVVAIVVACVFWPITLLWFIRNNDNFNNFNPKKR
jgi:hypothetical protein